MAGTATRSAWTLSWCAPVQAECDLDLLHHASKSAWATGTELCKLHARRLHRARPSCAEAELMQLRITAADQLSEGEPVPLPAKLHLTGILPRSDSGMALQAALRERDLPPDLHKRVLAYFNYSFQRVGGDAENELWQQLPHELRVRPVAMVLQCRVSPRLHDSQTCTSPCWPTPFTGSSVWMAMRRTSSGSSCPTSCG